MSQRPSNRNEQRRARALQREQGISYTHALNKVREAADQTTTIPAELRFVLSLMDDLRQNGADGAAQSVMRNRAADWFQDRSTVTKDTEDLLRLAGHGLESWAIHGLRAIEEDELIELANGWLPLTQPANAEPLQQIVGSWRDILRSREAPSPPRLPVRRESVIQILAHLQLALQRITKLRGATSWTGESQNAATQAAEQLGSALSQTFRGGVVTALPPATQAALVALRSR
jgi:hypothetical protein